MCSVVGCGSWRRGAQRFRLPEDPERRLEWVQFLFTVNKQRFKESSWTDITICSEHFTEDSFVNPSPPGTVQLKPGVVPSLSVRSEPDEPDPDQDHEETIEVASQCDQLEMRDSPFSYCEESELSFVAPQRSPVPSDNSDAFMYDYGRMLQKIANIDMIREKAALLQMKGKYVVNEKRLLQLFNHKCPLCGSKVKMEKVTYGVLLVLNQQCLQCEYRNQWKSQVNASVPTAADQHLTGGTEETPECQQTLPTDNTCSTITGVSEIVAVIDEESDLSEKIEESSDEGDMDSEEDWKPVKELSSDSELYDDDSEEGSGYKNNDYPPFAPKNSQLCTECGIFFNKWTPHTCEHKIKPYSCNICGKRCVSEVALNSHSRIHNENYEHSCKYCHVTFKTKVDKITHEQTHLIQGKPYKCPDCSETFATNKERRVHLEDHRGPQHLKCHICGIEFNRPRSLQRHLAVHTGEKPFKCLVCQRGLNQASHLKSHMRLHTGERPYKCQHCDKRFNHNVSLKSHVQCYHSANSGHEQYKYKSIKSKTVSDCVDAEDNGNKKGTDSGLDKVEEDDKEEEVQRGRAYMLKKTYRSTGRPIGRPRGTAAAGEIQGQCAKVKVWKFKRTHCSNDESEEEPTKGDTSFDLAEGRSEKKALSTSRLKGGSENSDSDFDLQKRKKKRHSSQKSGKSSGKWRGRPRKIQRVEDT